MSSFYLSILGIAIAYYIFALTTEADFLVSPFTLGLPYALAIWGILGYAGIGEPTAFGLGFLPMYGFITMSYILLTSSGVHNQKYLLKDAETTVNIFPDKFGEVKVKVGESFDFIQAKAEGITKPIVKGTFVKIKAFEGPFAVVTTDFESIVPRDVRSTIYKSFTSFIQLLLPRPKISGVCMVCYGTLTRSKEGTRCPNCNNVAHWDHITDWVNLKKQCPTCKTKLKMKGRYIELA